MSQDVDVQLQVWKDLAISKQILMGAATDALGLDAECTTEELKVALNQAIQRARDADLKIQETSSQAEQQVNEYKTRAANAEKARAEAEDDVAAAVKAREQAEHQLSKGKADNAEALKKAKAEVADKQSKLKAISKAIADTPENVVRKLKTLKKQKMDEAKLRAQAETRLQSMRKEKSKLEADLENRKSMLENAAKLVEQTRALHQICVTAEATISDLSKNKKDQITVPELDEAGLEALEQALEEN